jgi:hypothetical protein
MKMAFLPDAGEFREGESRGAKMCEIVEIACCKLSVMQLYYDLLLG